MSAPDSPGHRIQSRRMTRGWSQHDLAARAGIARTAVSALERDRLSPSVRTALALARVFDCSVEELFGTAAPPAPHTAAWAWPPRQDAARFWLADIGSQRWKFPVEPAADGERPHDGTAAQAPLDASSAAATLVLAGCDPAAGLLARLYEQSHPFRLIPLVRSSGAALELLRRGLVHVAGIHLGGGRGVENARIAQERLGSGFRLLRAHQWETGIATATGSGAGSVRALIRGRTRWVAREAGSGARQRLDQLFSRARRFERVAEDHRGVAALIRGGWGDAGVCPRLVSEESGLRFLSLGWESYDLCVAEQNWNDPRIAALRQIVQSTAFRQLIGDLPGYDSREAGQVQHV